MSSANPDAVANCATSLSGVLLRILIPSTVKDSVSAFAQNVQKSFTPVVDVASLIPSGASPDEVAFVMQNAALFRPSATDAATKSWDAVSGFYKSSDWPVKFIIGLIILTLFFIALPILIYMLMESFKNREDGLRFAVLAMIAALCYLPWIVVV